MTGRKTSQKGSKGTSVGGIKMHEVEERQAYRHVGDNGWNVTSEYHGY